MFLGLLDESEGVGEGITAGCTRICPFATGIMSWIGDMLYVLSDMVPCRGD